MSKENKNQNIQREQISLFTEKQNDHFADVRKSPPAWLEGFFMWSGSLPDVGLPAQGKSASHWLGLLTIRQ
jgi:hypothetical protein